MRMNAKVEFDRPIIPGRHYISPGGYEVSSARESVQFDFTESICNVSRKDARILNISCCHLDSDAFLDAEEKLGRVLKRIDHIDEFFIYTGEKGHEPELIPVALKNLQFEMSGGKVITVPQAIVKNCRVTCSQEP